MSTSIVLGDRLSLSCHFIVLHCWTGYQNYVKVGVDVLLWSWSDENIYYSLMSQCGGSKSFGSLISTYDNLWEV